MKRQVGLHEIRLAALAACGAVRHFLRAALLRRHESITFVGDTLVRSFLAGSRRCELPVRSLVELYPGIETTVAIQGPYETRGSTSLEEMVILCSILRHRGCRRVFEFGTYHGWGGLHLALNLPDDGAVFTLDLPGESDGTRLPLDPGDALWLGEASTAIAFHGSPVERKITQLLGDSASFDYRPLEGSFDLAFVDGAHSFDYVRNDTEAATRLLRDDGIIVWHDYQPMWPGVMDFLHRFAKTEPVFAIRGTTLAMHDRRWRQERRVEGPDMAPARGWWTARQLLVL